MKTPKFVQVVAFYKPDGVLTDFYDPEGRETLKKYIPFINLHPVGRLDFDSEGLLLLTNDGALNHALTDPQEEHDKTYWVQVEGGVSPEALDQMAHGVMVKGYLTQPCLVESIEAPALPERRKPVQAVGLTTWLQITLHEGKKRQIRHMTAAVGLPTLRLVRVEVAGVGLGQLKPGEWRALDPIEVMELKRHARPKD